MRFSALTLQGCDALTLGYRLGGGPPVALASNSGCASETFPDVEIPYAGQDLILFLRDDAGDGNTYDTETGGCHVFVDGSVTSGTTYFTDSYFDQDPGDCSALNGSASPVNFNGRIAVTLV